MRLLNVNTLTFKVFYEPKIPPYVIASHRWTDDEASLKDVQKKRNKDSTGFQKVLNFTNRIKAKFAHIEWIWIDTVCIDQKSSTEVHEAVNSMYKWYKKADCCLAYLHDVPNEPLQNSEWFTRGWTLQELLAPREVLFLNSRWKQIATRTQILDELEGATGIPAHVLRSNHNLGYIPVEERVEWVGRRRTTRPEDLAYCLLGICDVYMPLIYGEGDNAWDRLEDAVSKKYGRLVVLSRPKALRGGHSSLSLIYEPFRSRRDSLGQDSSESEESLSESDASLSESERHDINKRTLNPQRANFVPRPSEPQKDSRSPGPLRRIKDIGNLVTPEMKRANFVPRPSEPQKDSRSPRPLRTREGFINSEALLKVQKAPPRQRPSLTRRNGYYPVFPNS